MKIAGKLYMYMSVTNLENAIIGKVIGTDLFKTSCHRGKIKRRII